MADGTIETICFQQRELPQPDLDTSLTMKGWGWHVVVRHDDQTATLYAHLVDKRNSPIVVGNQVTQGTVIAYSDNSGGSTNPHLHVEYILQSGQKIDPEACIDDDVDVTGEWEGLAIGLQPFEPSQPAFMRVILYEQATFGICIRRSIG